MHFFFLSVIKRVSISRNRSSCSHWTTMDKLRGWLRRRGFALKFEDGGDDSVCFTTSTVIINSRLSEQSIISTLLHECGHVDVLQQRLKNRTARVAGSTFRQFVRTCGDARKQRSLGVKIDMVCEEIEAWDRGEVIAKKLKLKYNKKKYRIIRTRSLMTYFRWTARRRQVLRRPSQ